MIVTSNMVGKVENLGIDMFEWINQVVERIEIDEKKINKWKQKSSEKKVDNKSGFVTTVAKTEVTLWIIHFIFMPFWENQLLQTWTPSSEYCQIVHNHI